MVAERLAQRSTERRPSVPGPGFCFARQQSSFPAVSMVERQRSGHVMMVFDLEHLQKGILVRQIVAVPGLEGNARKADSGAVIGHDVLAIGQRGGALRHPKLVGARICAEAKHANQGEQNNEDGERDGESGTRGHNVSQAEESCSHGSIDGIAEAKQQPSLLRRLVAVRRCRRHMVHGFTHVADARRRPERGQWRRKRHRHGEATWPGGRSEVGRNVNSGARLDGSQRAPPFHWPAVPLAHRRQSPPPGWHGARHHAQRC
ncbi:hypothetical protein FGB62_365g010 [Gracilaria domingensis]|nr:hypothetical protein FGB62_365g010 [Gracilaria domingensis]